MGDNFDVRLLKRALGASRTDRSVKTLYGDRAWVADLDIVNELGAHTGCVNALRYNSPFRLVSRICVPAYLPAYLPALRWLILLSQLVDEWQSPRLGLR